MVHDSSLRKTDDLTKWLEMIHKEVVDLHHHLQLFEFTRDEILQKNPRIIHKDTTYLSWVMRSSTVDLVIRVCRLCDDDQRTASVVRFLKRLKKRRECLRRDRYIKLYEGSAVESLAARDFHALAGQECIEFPADVIEEDIGLLLKKQPFTQLNKFRNEYLAHLAKMKGDKPLYDALFEAIGKLADITKRYKQLLTGASVMDFTPTIQGNWQAILYEPLMAKGDNGTEDHAERVKNG